jgi:hypothetical protein
MASRMPHGFRRRTLVPLVAVLLASIPAEAVQAHTPIPTGTKRTFASDPSTFRITSSPGTWLSDAVRDSAEAHFHDADNNSGVPRLSYSSSGSGTVEYRTASTSPCGSGSTLWIQCATNGSANQNWHIYIRNLSTSGPAGWAWWDTASSCGSNTGMLVHKARDDP